MGNGEEATILEQLAERVHRRWMEQRTKDGWVYGPQRDDAKKQHPGLVPYDDLSDAEKEYDRATAQETIETLKELGYRIVKDDNR